MNGGGWDFDLPNAVRVDVQEGETKVIELRVMPLDHRGP
jgi:hypothetical protein